MIKKFMWFTISSFLLLLVIIIVEYKFNYVSLTFNTLRPVLLHGGGDKCLKDLEEVGIKYTKLGTIKENKCVIKNAVKIQNFPETDLSGPVLLSCPTAKKVSEFFDEIGATNVKHMGTYNCRKMRGSDIMSEHSYGTAIDISIINGASITNDWGKNTEQGLILKNAYISACSIFRNVLTPDSDKAHKNHFHIDTGMGVGCLPDWVNKVKRETISALNRLYISILTKPSA